MRETNTRMEVSVVFTPLRIFTFKTKPLDEEFEKYLFGTRTRVIERTTASRPCPSVPQAP